MDSSLFADIVIWSVYVALAAGGAAALWSAVHGVSTHSRTADAMASRSASWTGYATAGFVAVVLLGTFLWGSTTPIVSNGETFDDPLWLRLADMLIVSSLLLICVCSVIVVAARFRR